MLGRILNSIGEVVAPRPDPLVELNLLIQSHQVSLALEFITIKCAESDFNIDDKEEKSGLNSLHKASSCGSLDIVCDLLQRGANANEKCAHLGNSPLHYAALNGWKNIVDHLLKSGADTSQPNDAGEIPYELANAEVVKSLLLVDKQEIVQKVLSPMAFVRHNQAIQASELSSMENSLSTNITDTNSDKVDEEKEEKKENYDNMDQVKDATDATDELVDRIASSTISSPGQINTNTEFIDDYYDSGLDSDRINASTGGTRSTTSRSTASSSSYDDSSSSSFRETDTSRTAYGDDSERTDDAVNATSPGGTRPHFVPQLDLSRVTIVNPRKGRGGTQPLNASRQVPKLQPVPELNNLLLSTPSIDVPENKICNSVYSAQKVKNIHQCIGTYLQEQDEDKNDLQNGVLVASSQLHTAYHQSKSDAEMFRSIEKVLQDCELYLITPPIPIVIPKLEENATERQIEVFNKKMANIERQKKNNSNVLENQKVLLEKYLNADPNLIHLRLPTNVQNISNEYRRPGQCFIHIAATYHNTALIERLLAVSGSSAWVRDLEGKTPLHCAMLYDEREDRRHKKIQTIRLLKDAMLKERPHRCIVGPLAPLDMNGKTPLGCNSNNFIVPIPNDEPMQDGGPNSEIKKCLYERGDRSILPQSPLPERSGISPKKSLKNCSAPNTKIDSGSGSGSGSHSYKNLTYAFGEGSGWKPYMEDRVLICSPLLYENWHLFSVFDGHGGSTVSEYLSSNFSRVLKNALQDGGIVKNSDLTSNQQLSNAIRNACCTIEHELKNLPKLEVFRKSDKVHDNGQALGCTCPIEDSGSTGLICIVTPTAYAFANIGDSRGFICSNDGAVKFSTTDHTPYLQTEKERAVAAGAHADLLEDGIIKVDFGSQSNSILRPSRNFGDFLFKQNTLLPPDKQIVTSIPDVTVFPHVETDDFIFLACDGL